MAGPHVHRSCSEADVVAIHSGLALRYLRDDLDLPTAELRPQSEPLVNNRPGRAVISPGLHEHGPARPATVDVRALLWGREDLRHRTGLLIRRTACGRF